MLDKELREMLPAARYRAIRGRMTFHPLPEPTAEDATRRAALDGKASKQAVRLDPPSTGAIPERRRQVDED